MKTWLSPIATATAIGITSVTLSVGTLTPTTTIAPNGVLSPILTSTATRSAPATR